MSTITKILAREILDSRGNPTIEVDLHLDDTFFGRAAVPSGASTGSKEALELRDNDDKRYLGKGVLEATRNVNEVIVTAIVGKNFDSQSDLDNFLIELDATENKSKLGANAILGVSLAFAKAKAASDDKQLFEYIGNGKELPRPMMNIINGGAHADNKIDIQEFMVIPMSFESSREAVRCGAEIFHTLRKLLKEDDHNTNVGDEGGFAPNLDSANEALEYIIKAIETAGYEPGSDVAIALDSAASEFYKDGKYHIEGDELDSQEMVEYYEKLVEKYPIISIEDPMDENDQDGWKAITEALDDKIQIVGDDLFVTNPKILKEGIASGLANSILIKLNQIGTLTETMETIRIAQENNYTTIISHRSGETEDTTISHLAVGSGAGQIKTGSLCRTDRMCKYNELIRIEELI